MKSLIDRIDELALRLDPFGIDPDYIGTGTVEDRLPWLEMWQAEELETEDRQTLEDILKALNKAKKDAGRMIQAMYDGREVVIVGSQSEYNSAIFWKNQDGRTCSFSREIGIIKHPADDSTLAEHFQNMINEGSHIYVRGPKED